MSHLTPEILRAAAARIYFPGAGWRGGNEFMCPAVGWVGGAECRALFTKLLREHEVSMTGTLSHKGIKNAGLFITEESQNLRFDFLNLLAESLED